MILVKIVDTNMTVRCSCLKMYVKLRYVKGQLEELTAEYHFTKLKYVLEETTEFNNRKTFFVRCVVGDQ